MDLTFDQFGASALEVVPGYGHGTLIHLSSVYVPRSCLNALPPPDLRRQPQSDESPLICESLLGIRADLAVTHLT